MPNTDNTEQSQVVRRKVKDSLFTALFREKEYTLQLYQAIHPEDTDTTVNDITNVNIENVLVNALYNDLGFKVKDRLIILVEAQSSWSMNIIPRAFLYLAKTYKDYFRSQQFDLYSTTKIAIPEPELYVIYIQERKNAPKIITLSEEFFDGKAIALDLKIKMLYGENKSDIIGQYVRFSRVITEQIKLYGYKLKAIEETLRICKDQKILEDYLKKHEKEVIDMYNFLFTDEEIQQFHDADMRAKGRAEERKSLLNTLLSQGIITPQQAEQFAQAE